MKEREGMKSMNKKEKNDPVTLSAEEYLQWIRIKKENCVRKDGWTFREKKNPAQMPGNL